MQRCDHSGDGMRAVAMIGLLVALAAALSSVGCSGRHDGAVMTPVLPTTSVSPTSSPAPTTTFEPTETHAPDPWDQYEPATLSQIIELARQEIGALPDNTVYLEMDPNHMHPSQVPVVYTGELRRTPEERLEAIVIWSRTLLPQLSQAEVKAIFAQEGRFTEGTVEYWLPVQSLLILAMENELEPESEMVLFVQWIGVMTLSGESDWIFIVNEFLPPS